MNERMIERNKLDNIPIERSEIGPLVRDLYKIKWSICSLLTLIGARVSVIIIK